MSRTRRSLVLVVVLLVVLAGCSSEGTDGGAPKAPGGGGADADAPPRGSDGGDGGGGGDQADQSLLQTNQALVMTANVTLEVDDYDAARGRLASLARQRGGYVAGSDRTTHRRENATWTTGRLVLRVPSAEFGPTFESVRETGTVRRASSDTVDVTDRLVDIEARLANLRSQRDRLRALYDRANETEAVLRVGERLAEVQGEIERLRATQRSLEDRVAYSTITVDLAEPEPAPAEETPTPTAPYHETGLVDAFASSVHGVVVVTRTVVVTAAYAAPYLAAFGLPLAGLAAATRRRGLW